MVDPSKGSIRKLWKIYKTLIKKWQHSNKSPPNEPDVEFKPKNKIYLELVDDKQEKIKKMNGVRSFRCNSQSLSGEDRNMNRGFYKHKSVDNFIPSSSPNFSRSTSKRSATPTPASLYKSMSRRSSNSLPPFEQPTTSPPFLGRNPSRRSSTPIMFSNSSGMLKQPPIERKLECTLEELCYGCQKKIKITRDVLKNNGKIVQEEELVTIKVKPGWKKGTKIKFEGMGNEKPGQYPADIVFVVAEKRHPLFRREGDDLELAVEIPLVKALTGCNISIPILGGEKMKVTVQDVIYPGYEKIIPGEGMPNPKDRASRGNLKVTFLVNFPTRLSDEQRSDVLSILQG
ncbi:hypothetical protein UlMin_035855 [Ulmus minor]